MRNENKSKCLQKFRVSSKQDKDCYRKTTPYLEQPSRHDSTSCDKGHNKPFGQTDRQTDSLYFIAETPRGKHAQRSTMGNKIW